MLDPQKFLENSFLFLENNFAKKIYKKNDDVEIVFTNKTLSIEIMYYWGIDKNYHIDIIIERFGIGQSEDIVKHYILTNGKYRIETERVEKNSVRKNLLDFYELFEKVQLQKLKIQMIEKKVEEQIALYSKFLNENIFKLQ